MARRFYRFADLLERRIVGDRADLHRKQKNYGFPRSLHLVGGRTPTALFDADLVDAWVEARLSAEADETNAA